MKRNVGIVLFNGVEVLDFASPFEVFSVASELNNFEIFEVFTISENMTPIISVNGLSVNAKYTFSDCPKIDVLIIPGGSRTNQLLENQTFLDFIDERHKTSEITVSICSGARVLGKLGLLDGIQYATHHQVYDHLIEIAPNGIPMRDLRFVSDGKVYTSGEISAGIDLSFHVLSTLCGNDILKETAEYMEYELKYDNIKANKKFSLYELLRVYV